MDCSKFDLAMAVAPACSFRCEMAKVMSPSDIVITGEVFRAMPIPAGAASLVACTRSGRVNCHYRKGRVAERGDSAQICSAAAESINVRLVADILAPAIILSSPGRSRRRPWCLFAIANRSRVRTGRTTFPNVGRHSLHCKRHRRGRRRAVIYRK